MRGQGNIDASRADPADAPAPGGSGFQAIAVLPASGPAADSPHLLIWTGALLGSATVHALLVATALVGMMQRESLEAERGGAPLAVELVVGHESSAASEAGAAPQTTPDRPDSDAPPDPAPRAAETPPQSPEETRIAAQPGPVQPLEKPEAVLPEGENGEVATPQPQQEAQEPEPAPPPAVRRAEAGQREARRLRAAREQAERKRRAAQARVEKERRERQAAARARQAQQQHNAPGTGGAERGRGNERTTSAASTRGGSGGRGQTAGTANAATHRANVLAHLARFKRYPDSARSRGVTGRAIVSFVVSASGGASNIALAKSSGSPDLDRATLDMVRRAVPFPSGPASLTITAGMTYNLR